MYLNSGIARSVWKIPSIIRKNRSRYPIVVPKFWNVKLCEHAASVRGSHASASIVMHWNPVLCKCCGRTLSATKDLPA